MSEVTWTVESVAEALMKVISASKDERTTSNDLNKFCRDNKFRQLGSGGYRTAYLVKSSENSFVIKIAHNSGWAAEANKAEVKFFERTKSPGLAAIFKSHQAENTYPLWLIVEFIPKMFEYPEERSKLEDMVHSTKKNVEVPEKYAELVKFLRENRLSDLHRGNLGYRADGTVVIVDYAQ